MRDQHSPRRSKAAAVLTAFALAVAGLAVAAPAQAAEPDLDTTVDVTAASADDGLSVEVSGTGYVDLPPASTGAPASGVYATLRDPATQPDDAINADTSIVPAVAFIWNGAITDGDWQTTLSADAADLDPDASYEVVIWVAHGNITDATKLATIPVTLTDAQHDALFPADPGDDPTPEPSDEPTTEPTTEPTDEPTDEPADPDATPAADVSVSAASAADGLELAVSGTGFTDLPTASTGAPASGVYAALRDPATQPDDAVNADTSIVPAVAFIWNGAITDGDWQTTLSADAADLDPDASYEVVIWTAHGDITDATKLATIPVTLTDAQHDALFADAGDEPTPEPTSEPTTDPTTEPTADPTTTPTATPTTAPTASPAADPTPRIVCTTEQVPAVAGTAHLTWGVKNSFVSYIESGVADGTVSTTGGAGRSGNTFSWGAGSGTLDASGQGTLSFPGSVHFTGHDGILDTTISDLRVRVSGGSAVLLADVASTDMSGADVSAGDITFATLSTSGWGQTGGNASVSLTAAGAKAFAGFYDAGQAMDPLTVSFSGARAATTQQVCHDADGNRVNPDGTPYTGPSLSASGPRVNTGGLAQAGLGEGGPMGWIPLVGGLLLLTVIIRRSQAARR